MTELGMKLSISAALAGALLLAATPGYAYSKKVETACKRDFYSLCPAYSPGSTELRRCFESNRRQLSRKCKNALVDAGEVPARFLSDR